jgi:hypothetical protein
MSKPLAIVGLWVGAALLSVVAGSACAEELRPQLNSSMILNMLARPAESPQEAFGAALRSDAPVPRAARADEGEVQPDGSVRYGRGNTSMTITVRNPCPPGDLAHEAAYLRSLPGRRR